MKTQKTNSKVTVKHDEIKLKPRSLPCKLTNDELIEAGKELAQLHGEYVRLEEQKKRLVSDFKAKTDAKEADISIMSNKVTTETEWRDTNVMGVANTPEIGKLTVYRLDTGEKVGVETMTDEQLQRNLPMEIPEYEKKPLSDEDKETHEALTKKIEESLSQDEGTASEDSDLKDVI